MIQKFDYYRHSEKPEFILCNPDGSQLAVLTAEETECALRFNDTSELSFVVYEGASDGYDLLETNRQILVEDLGYFIIDTVEEDSTDPTHGSKKVNAKSAQYELGFKIVDYLSGVYPFYDSTGNFDENGDPATFIGYVLSLAPGWSIEKVDAALESRYRSLEVTKQTLLDVLYSTASKAYQCIFHFDFLNRTISVDAVSTLTETDTNKTDIFLSFDNVIDGMNIRETADGIKTKVYVYGQDLDIRQVNPTGESYIVNLDYYKTPEWMSEDLIAAIDTWEERVAGIRSEYSSLLTDLRKKRQDKTVLDAELVALEGEKASYDSVISAQIEQGFTNVEDQARYNENLNALKEVESKISEKKAEIEEAQQLIDSLLVRVSDANTSCSFEANFSDEQIRVLSNYLIEGEYSNNNYIVTDQMTAEEIQDEAQELYDEGVLVAQKLSQPAFTLSVEAKAFIHMEEFAPFTNQLELGCMVTAEKTDGVYYTPILLEMEFSWDDKEDFSLSFGNRFRLDDAGCTYEELLGTAANTSSSISANWDSIVDFDRNYKNSISELLGNAFNVALHSIVSSSNQDIVWDASGLTCRKYDEQTGTYSAEQFKIINNKIAFTDDGWNTIKTVLGKISLDGGSTKYGLAAEVIVGTLLAGNNLVITNESGTFRVDGNGVSFVAKNENGDPVTDADGNKTYIDLEDFILDEVEKVKIDGSSILSTYYSITEPKLPNVGDLWFVNGEGDPPEGFAKGKLYRYNGTGWDAIQDADISEAISAAKDAAEAADGKITSYYTDEIPEDPSLGDLWYVAGDVVGYTKYKFYRFNGTEWELIEDGDIAEAAKKAADAAALADKKICTFYQFETPDNGDVSHGDLWFVVADKDTSATKNADGYIVGKLYRYTADNANGVWNPVQDVDLETAVKNAEDAKAAADGKITSYYQISEPDDASEGDLWYVMGKESEEAPNGYIKGKTYRYSSDEKWVLLEDTDLADAIKQTQGLLEETRNLVDGKITTYYQVELPYGSVSAQTNTAPVYLEYLSYVGDLWYNPDEKITRRYTSLYEEGSDYPYVLKWKSFDTEVPEEVYDKIDGKTTLFYLDAVPENPSDGDLWYVTGDVSGYSFGRFYRYSSGRWVIIADSKLDEVANLANDAKALVDQKITTFYQFKTPENPSYGDLWFVSEEGEYTNNDDGYTVGKLYRRGNDSWDAVQDRDLIEAVEKANDAKATADGKITSYYQIDMPESQNEGDLWYVMGSGTPADGFVKGRTYRYSAQEQTWLLLEDTYLADAILTAQTVIDGKISSYYQKDAPHSEYKGISASSPQYLDCLTWEGDLWYNTDTAETKRYTQKNNDSGTYDFIWEDMSSSIPEELVDKIDGKVTLFYQADIPVEYISNNDLWYVLAGGSGEEKGYAVERFYRYNESSEEWDLIADSSILEAFNQANVALDKAEEALGLADGKISSYYQIEQPHDEVYASLEDDPGYLENVKYNGDLWYNPDTKITKRYTQVIVEGEQYHLVWKPFDTEVPQEVWDKLDGQKEIYVTCPIDGFKATDLWLYAGDGKQSAVSSPSEDNFEAPYETVSGTKTYFVKSDLLVATADSSDYKPTLWKKYSANIDKGNDTFEFHLNDDGMLLKNGSIQMVTNSNTIDINPDVGFKISRNNESKFWADADGNLHLSGKLEAATGTFKGTFAGTLGIGGTESNPNFSVNSNGDVKITSGEIYLGAQGTDGKYAFQVDANGNLYAKSGTFSGDVTWRGNAISGKYLSLYGMEIYKLGEDGKVVYEDGEAVVTFKVDNNGDVTVGGNISLDTDSFITWEDVEEDEDGIIAEKAAGLVEALATGEYTALTNTFISGRKIYSPEIYSNNFIVNPETETTSGGLTINGYFAGKKENMFSISYTDTGSAPVTNISTYGILNMDSSVYFNWDIKFNAPVNEYIKVYGSVDFTDANVKGIAGSGGVAKFG